MAKVKTELTTAIYDVSIACDYRCIYCRNDWDKLKDASIPDLKQINIILNKIKTKGFTRIIYTGGEFFLMPHWKEVVELTKKLGLEIWIISNGYSFDKKQISFLEKNITRINISFHAPNSKLYNEIMRPPSSKAFNKVIKNMKIIGDSAITLGIFFSPINSNYDRLYETIYKLHQEGVRIKDVNVNRIVNTQTTKNFLKLQKPLNLFKHQTIVQQAIKINEEIGEITAFLEAYPLCFLNSFIKNPQESAALNRPCYLGRKAIALNFDGSMKLCPANNQNISKPITQDYDFDRNKDLTEFNDNIYWRNKTCIKCLYWKGCLGGCHATKGKLFADDPLLIDDEIEFKEGIDQILFDLLLKLYKPFLSSEYQKAAIQYTVYSKKKYNFPIGIIALKVTSSGGRFIEIAIIPRLKGSFYSFLILNHFLQLHKFDKIGWTVHKANLPSIKLLKNLRGGFFEKTVKNKKRIEAEGFFRPCGNVSKKMQETLSLLLYESSEKFIKWLKEYNKRKKELNQLNKYLGVI